MKKINLFICLLIFGVCFAHAQINAGLVLQYNFTNYSMSPTVGSINGNPVLCAPMADRNAVDSNAVDMTANNSFINLGNDPNVSSLTDSMSASVWFYPTANTGSYQVILSKWGDGSNKDHFWMAYNNGGIYFATATANSGYLAASGVSLNNWHHMVMTWDRVNYNNVKIYLDGNLVYNNVFGSAGIPNITSPQDLLLGAQYSNAMPFRYFYGGVDDMRIYNRIISAQDVSDLYTLGLPSKRIYVDYTASGANDGTSWTNAYTNLDQALVVANQLDTIWVANTGVYVPTIDNQGTLFSTPQEAHYALKSDVVILGGFTGNENTLSQRNPYTNKVTLSGNLTSENVIRIISAQNVVLDGFIITGGYSDANSSNKIGAGVYVSTSSNVLLQNCEIKNNNSHVHGGGAYIDNSTINFNRVGFISNNVNLYDGGALYLNYSTSNLYNCLFFNNFSNRYGGAFVAVSSNTDVINSTFHDNAGGQNHFQFSINSNVDFYHSIFSNNNITSTQITGTNNASYSVNECLVSSVYGGLYSTSTISGQANYVDLNNLDFNQTSSSLGVNPSISISYALLDSLDYEGKNRYQGTSKDFGAYEFNEIVTNVSEKMLNNNEPVLYPNPVIDKLNVNSTEIVEISIHDITGKLIKTKNNSNVIDVSDLNKGVYLIKIKLVNSSYTQKFIKK